MLKLLRSRVRRTNACTSFQTVKPSREGKQIRHQGWQRFYVHCASVAVMLVIVAPSMHELQLNSNEDAFSGSPARPQRTTSVHARSRAANGILKHHIGTVLVHSADGCHSWCSHAWAAPLPDLNGHHGPCPSDTRRALGARRRLSPSISLHCGHC
jgi:hypothetical protein